VRPERDELGLTELRQLLDGNPKSYAHLQFDVLVGLVDLVGHLRRRGSVRGRHDPVEQLLVRQLRHTVRDAHVQHELRLGQLGQLGNLRRPRGLRVGRP
jgi:hypothetical protein